MMSTQHIALLDQLRFGVTSLERSQAFKDLLVLEAEGAFAEADFLDLIDNHDFVFQTYAIGALGRLKIKGSISKLKKLFKVSKDPLILPALLETFSKFESDDFVGEVIKKVKSLAPQNNPATDGDSAFLMEQMIIPTLKYLQISGAQGIEGVISRFLNDVNPTVRWHTLVTFDKLNLIFKTADLERFQKNDQSALVREQAALMLEKRNYRK